MAAGEVRIGDKNTIIECTVKDQAGTAVDLTDITLSQFIFRKSTGAAVTKDAVFVTTGADGKLKYTTVATDFDVAGDWQLQVYVKWSDREWKSDIQNFMVHPNLPTT